MIEFSADFEVSWQSVSQSVGRFGSIVSSLSVTVLGLFGVVVIYSSSHHRKLLSPLDQWWFHDFTYWHWLLSHRSSSSSSCARQFVVVGVGGSKYLNYLDDWFRSDERVCLHCSALFCSVCNGDGGGEHCRQTDAVSCFGCWQQLILMMAVMIISCCCCYLCWRRRRLCGDHCY